MFIPSDIADRLYGWHIPPKHLLVQHCCPNMQLSPVCLQAPQQTPNWHFIEQQSPFVPQGIQSLVHAGAAAHVPLLHDPEQHWLFSAQVAPSPMHGLQAPPTQRFEQHCWFPPHDAPLPKQPGGPHTPLHCIPQHSVPALHGVPSVLHIATPLELLEDDELLDVELLLDAAPPAPPVLPLPLLLDDDAFVPPVPLLDDDEPALSAKRSPPSMPHPSAAMARAVIERAKARAWRGP